MISGRFYSRLVIRLTALVAMVVVVEEERGRLEVGK